MKTTVLTVPDMMCGHCEMTVRKALSALDGVSDLSVDLQKKTVTVSHAAGISAEALLGAIAAEGFHPQL